MGRVIVIESVTLDGVMQAPARPDEDERGGFAHGGWAVPYADQVMASAMGRRMAGEGSLLLGRRTCLDLQAAWSGRTDNPYSAVLDTRLKHVASTTLREPLPWRNSALLEGDAVDAVARLRERESSDIGVIGSGELVRSLLPRGLVDELVLLIHPLVLGSGRRLFPEGARLPLRLVEATPTSAGVVIAVYRSAEPAAG